MRGELSNTNLPHYFYVPYSKDPQDGLKLVRLGRMIHPQLSQSNLEPIQSLKQESHQSEKQELQQESQKQEPQQESHQSYLKIFCFVSSGFVSYVSVFNEHWCANKSLTANFVYYWGHAKHFDSSNMTLIDLPLLKKYPQLSSLT